MVRIAIIDDEINDRELLGSYFHRFAIEKEKAKEVEVQLFDSGEAFLAEFREDYDLICLDIDMLGVDGIEVAKRIRAVDERVAIIFITNLAQMAIRGYEVRALDFILKPVNYYAFSLKMQSIFVIINSKKVRNILIMLSGETIKISSDDLYYIEVSGHYLYYHTTWGVYKQKSSLKEVEQNLRGLSFIRCNNCYLVNLEHVDAVRGEDIRIDGTYLRMSRSKKKEFLSALTNYMGGTGK